jgi:uncharacterized membrane protein
MSPLAIILIIIAAITHAGWNFAGKRQHPSSALFLIASVMGGLCLLPVVCYYRVQFPLIPTAVWKWVALTGFFQAGYFAALAAAYRAGDLSIVYPMARSVPTLLVTGLAIIFGTGHAISGLCLCGIALVVLGCTVLPLGNFRGVRVRDYFNACCCLAMLAAVGTAGYMMIDSLALKLMCDMPGRPFSKIGAALAYAPLEILSTSFWLGLYVLLNPVERREFATVINGAKKHAFLMGVGIYGAYTLVLVAMNFAEHVSYVMAFRQMSIPLGAMLGMAVLNESRPLPKKLGIATVFVGVVMVGLG